MLRRSLALLSKRSSSVMQHFPRLERESAEAARGRKRMKSAMVQGNMACIHPHSQQMTQTARQSETAQLVAARSKKGPNEAMLHEANWISQQLTQDRMPGFSSQTTTTTKEHVGGLDINYTRHRSLESSSESGLRAESDQSIDFAVRQGEEVVGGSVSWDSSGKVSRSGFYYQNHDQRMDVQLPTPGGSQHFGMRHEHSIPLWEEKVGTDTLGAGTRGSAYVFQNYPTAEGVQVKGTAHANVGCTADLYNTTTAQSNHSLMSHSTTTTHEKTADLGLNAGVGGNAEASANGLGAGAEAGCEMHGKTSIPVPLTKTEMHTNTEKGLLQSETTTVKTEEILAETSNDAIEATGDVVNEAADAAMGSGTFAGCKIIKKVVVDGKAVETKEVTESVVPALVGAVAKVSVGAALTTSTTTTSVAVGAWGLPTLVSSTVAVGPGIVVLAPVGFFAYHATKWVVREINKM